MVEKSEDMVHIKKNTRQILRPVFEFLIKFHYFQEQFILA